MRKIALTGLWAGGVAGALFAFACSSSTKTGAASKDGGNDASSTGDGSVGGKGGAGGAGTGGKGGAAGSTGGTATSQEAGSEAGVTPGTAICLGMTGAAQITCGQYIVEHITACADCHSPRGATGQIVAGMELAGNPSLADLTPVSPSDGKGNIPAPNLTQLKAQGWTAADVMNAFLNGIDKNGKDLFPIMNYYTMHNMAHDDAAAIAAYILSLTPITNAIPAREPLPSPLDVIPFREAPVPYAEIPDPVIAASDPSYADAMKGKYLAAQLGPCMECHTAQKPITNAIDMSKPFAGGHVFDLGPLGKITSLNITPDMTGIMGWTPGMVKTAVKLGLDDKGKHLCPPMPFGPTGAFGGMTDADALAIGAYITHLKPIPNGLPDGGMFIMRDCPPPPPPAEAGAPTDAATGG